VPLFGHLGWDNNACILTCVIVGRWWKCSLSHRAYGYPTYTTISSNFPTLQLFGKKWKENKRKIVLPNFKKE
jgi:hypothetical protein